METSKKHIRDVYEYVQKQSESQSNAMLQHDPPTKYAFAIVSIALPIMANLLPEIADVSKKLPGWAMVILLLLVAVTMLVLFLTALFGVRSLTPRRLALPSMRKSLQLLKLQKSDSVDSDILIRQMTLNYVNAFKQNERRHNQRTVKKSRIFRKYFKLSFIALVTFSAWFGVCIIFLQSS